MADTKLLISPFDLTFMVATMTQIIATILWMKNWMFSYYSKSFC
jgi:hypothetical protein